VACKVWTISRNGIHSAVICQGDRDRDKEALWIHNHDDHDHNDNSITRRDITKNTSTKILKQFKEIQDEKRGFQQQGKESEQVDDYEAPTLLQQIQSRNQYKPRTNNKVASTRGNIGGLTPKEILEDIDSWDWGYKRQGDGASVRVKECPMCHPIKGRLDNMYALVVDLKKAVFFCHRCGSKGHWRQMKRFMEEEDGEKV